MRIAQQIKTFVPLWARENQVLSAEFQVHDGEEVGTSLHKEVGTGVIETDSPPDVSDDARHGHGDAVPGIPGNCTCFEGQCTCVEKFQVHEKSLQAIESTEEVSRNISKVPQVPGSERYNVLDRGEKQTLVSKASFQVEGDTAHNVLLPTPLYSEKRGTLGTAKPLRSSGSSVNHPALCRHGKQYVRADGSRLCIQCWQALPPGGTVWAPEAASERCGDGPHEAWPAHPNMPNIRQCRHCPYVWRAEPAPLGNVGRHQAPCSHCGETWHWPTTRNTWLCAECITTGSVAVKGWRPSQLGDNNRGDARIKMVPDVLYRE